MPIISIANQKGGVGKTTTTINLAAALQRCGKSVLLIDADPQASLSQSLGIKDEPDLNLYTELSKEMRGENGDLSSAILPTRSNLSIIPSSIDLAGAELELVSVYGREQVLTWLLEKVKNQYEYIFIDCAPAMGMLTVNALAASDKILMPLIPEYLPLKALRSFMYHFKSVQKLNKKLSVLGFVFTRYDDRRTMNRQIHSELENEFGDKVFQTRIRSNIQLAKAQEAGLDIFSFDKKSHGAEDYGLLATEFLSKLQGAKVLVQSIAAIQ